MDGQQESSYGVERTSYLNRTLNLKYLLPMASHYVLRSRKHQVVNLKDVPVGISAFRTANEIPPTLDLTSCTRCLLPKITTYDTTHLHCWPKSSQMPTRLLYAGSECDPTCPRLEIRPAWQLYTVLGHCWGDQSAILATTKATLNDLLLEILWGNLPKTFQDAVSTTRPLNINYLGIDSLCIHQDDTSDWKAEFVKMTEAYSGAYLTMASVELLSRMAYGLHFYGNDLVIDKNFVFAGSALSKHEIKSILGVQDAALQITGLVIPCTMNIGMKSSQIYSMHLLEVREETELAYTDITCDVEPVQDLVKVLCLLVGASSK